MTAALYHAPVQTLSQIKVLLQARGLSPNHALGQNFLCDHNLITKLIDASGVAHADLVLEIGPGTGTLTESLLERGATVVACELDRGLVDLLTETLADHIAAGRLTLVHADCLESRRALNPALADALGDRPFKLVANLPYGAASPLMALLATDPACRGQFVTIQKEVAMRLRAVPGTKDYSELGVIVQAMAEVSKIATLPPECFWPRPKVTSEMIAITPRDTPLTEDPPALARLCHTLFTRRRKQIGAILGRNTPLPEGVDPTARPESLSVEQLVALSRLIDTAPGD